MAPREHHTWAINHVTCGWIVLFSLLLLSKCLILAFGNISIQNHDSSIYKKSNCGKTLNSMYYATCRQHVCGQNKDNLCLHAARTLIWRSCAFNRGPMTMPVLDGVCGTSESLFWKRKKSIYCWTRSRPTWTFGESDDQVRDKSESKYQRVQDKSETIEKRLESGLESETGLEYYSPTGERRPPRPSQAPSRPGSRRSVPDAGNPEMLEFALSQETARTAPLLPPVEGREENLLFRFVSVPPLVQGPAVPTFSKKEQFPFPPGSQVHGTTVCDALPPHSRPRPILPVAKRVRFGDDIPPHAPLASPVRDPGSSVRMPQNAPPSVPSTPTPFRCTTTGTSIVPLEPLAQRLEAWLTLPSLSRWLTRTIRLGYAIQFARRPPKFNGVLETSVAVRNAPVLREEIAVLLAKDAIEPVPPAKMRQGFYSPYFIVPKKGGGLRPILDLRVLNRALHKLPLKMLTHRRMIKCIQPQDWFAAIDLKDAYFHVSILPRHRPFLRFAFEGRAWQYRVLPFGLSLSPRVFTKVVEGALTPLREVGVRILNYLDDWLILAQSREQLGDHRDLVLRHLSQLGLRVNWEKSKLSRHLLLWSHTQFKSLRAVHIPGQLNRAADALSQ